MEVSVTARLSTVVEPEAGLQGEGPVAPELGPPVQPTAETPSATRSAGAFMARAGGLTNKCRGARSARPPDPETHHPGIELGSYLTHNRLVDEGPVRIVGITLHRNDLDAAGCQLDPARRALADAEHRHA